MTYSEKLKDPRWQRRRLDILNRDGFTCQYCCDKEKMLVIHHTYYEKNIEPWEAKDEHLITLCDDCHKYFHESMKKYHSLIIDSMKLKLKDPFIISCAYELFRDFDNLNDLIYSLWELKNKENEVLDALRIIPEIRRNYQIK